MVFAHRRTRMPKKSYKPEEIVAKLRQVDVLTSQGQGVAEAIRSIGHDVYYLEPDEWKSDTKNYSIYLNGQWIEVDESKMLSPVGGLNPTGRAIVWYDVNEYGIGVRCFT